MISSFGLLEDVFLNPSAIAFRNEALSSPKSKLNQYMLFVNICKEDKPRGQVLHQFARKEATGLAFLGELLDNSVGVRHIYAYFRHFLIHTIEALKCTSIYSFESINKWLGLHFSTDPKL